MRRRLLMKKRLQRRRLKALKAAVNQRLGDSTATSNFDLMSAGLTDPFSG